MKVAMISPHEIARKTPSGWQTNGEASIFLLHHQNPPTRRKWLALENELPNLDLIIIYVSGDSIDTSRRLAKLNVPPEKIVFVFCPCNLPEKRLHLEAAGFAASKTILSNCGGFNILYPTYLYLLKHGCLPD